MTPREQVVAEALSWQRTPYLHAGRIKGAGVDCAMLLAEVYERCGVFPRIEPEEYPRDWYMHRSEERYLDLVRQHAREVEGPPQPGDIVLWRFGHCYSHGGIVLQWPEFVHAYRIAREVVRDDATTNLEIASRKVAFFSPWED